MIYKKVFTPCEMLLYLSSKFRYEWLITGLRFKSWISYTASNMRITLNNEMKSMQKEAAVACVQGSIICLEKTMKKT